MSLYFDPLNEACKSVTGGIARLSALTVKLINRDNDCAPHTCYLLLHPDGGEETRLLMKQRGNDYEITLRFYRNGLYFYRFEVDGTPFGRGALRRGKSDCREDWQITVFDENFSTPEWLKGGVMYQIFPDRFYKSGNYPISEHKILRSDWGGTPRFRPNEYGKVQNNDFFGGNFNGIREKLPYLQELGVSVIYLNPIFEAYSNHRYDTGDYKKIDSLLGTEEDFKNLIKSAKERGIRVILDGVFNHTGDDSRYFNKYGRYESLGAYQSTASPYSDWYHFREFPTSYDSWWGIETLPAVNEQSESYLEFMFGDDGVIKKWLKCGIGGYRLDVADELPDFFLERLRTAVKEENKDAVIIGEVWEDASNKIAYDVRRRYFQGCELDTVMNYPLKNAIINYVLTGNATALRETVFLLIDNYPKQSLDALMNILGTHDTCRILTVLGGKPAENKEEMAITSMTQEEKERAREKLKMAALLQYTLPGVPCVYYGDENGAEGYLDPFCRGCYDWEHTDEDLRAFYRLLGKIRREKLAKIFKDGTYREVYSDGACLVFERRNANGCVYVCVNNARGKHAIRLNGEYREYLTGKRYKDAYVLGDYSYAILAKIK